MTNVYCKSVLSIALLFFAGLVFSKNWQIMPLPDSSVSQLNTSLLRGEISQALAKDLNRIIEAERLFIDCSKRYCGEASLNSALQIIAKQAPEVDLVLLYGLNTSTTQTLYFSLVDPLSFQRYASFDLPILTSDGILSASQLRSLSRPLSVQVTKALASLKKISEFDLMLKGFSMEELSPFASFIMAQSRETKIRLVKSSKLDTTLAEFMPLVKVDYRITTPLSHAQFNQLALGFFTQYDIDAVSEFNQTQEHFIVSRLGSPYTPSLLSSASILIASLLLALLVIKRQMHLHRLERFAQHKQVSQWLAVFERASAPWYFLGSKWKNQYSYWQRLEKESEDFAKQAKLFFDAGDFISAKLFLSKALNLNSDEQKAKQLSVKIEKQENSEKALSDKEQWVRNKVAKAMNNYRANQPYKALRQAYEALTHCENEKKLKRQHKAIKRLIQKIINEYSANITSVELSELGSDETSLVSTCEQVNIGRSGEFEQSSFEQSNLLTQPDITLTWFSINHKALSRLGKHCCIRREGKRFSIVDQGSTNGSFVNKAPLEAHAAQVLEDKSVLYLGSESELSAVKLNINIHSKGDLLKLYIDSQMEHALERAELARVWPDYSLALRRSLIMTPQSFVLAYCNIEQSIKVVAESQRHAPADDYDLIVEIRLGEQACIWPLIDKPEDEMPSCNGEVIMGKLPLTLPCDIKFKSYHIHIDEQIWARAAHAK